MQYSMNSATKEDNVKSVVHLPLYTASPSMTASAAHLATADTLSSNAIADFVRVTNVLLLLPLLPPVPTTTIAATAYR